MKIPPRTISIIVKVSAFVIGLSIVFAYLSEILQVANNLHK